MHARTSDELARSEVGRGYELAMKYIPAMLGAGAELARSEPGTS